jgi:hypothetical protein
MLPFPGTQVNLPTQAKTPTLDGPTLHTPVGRLPQPFLRHPPETPPDPPVQCIALSHTGREGGGQGADGAPDDSVDLPDHCALFPHAGLQKLLEEVHDVPICTLACHQAKEPWVGDAVTAPLQVRIHPPRYPDWGTSTRCAMAVWHLRGLRKPCERSCQVGATIGSLTARIPSCATRHRTAGSPRGRTPPVPVGMSTRHTGIGWEVPDFRSRSRAPRCSSRVAAHLVMDCVSSPAAPRVRLTAWKALCSASRVLLPVRACTRCVGGSPVSLPTEGLESASRCVCSEHTQGPSPQPGQGGPSRSFPVGSLDPCHAARPPHSRRWVLLVSPQKKRATSAGHAGVPTEREPRKAPRSPPPHTALRQWPSHAADPPSHD